MHAIDHARRADLTHYLWSTVRLADPHQRRVAHRLPLDGPQPGDRGCGASRPTRAIEVPPRRIKDIVRGCQSVTAHRALHIGRAGGPCGRPQPSGRETTGRIGDGSDGRTGSPFGRESLPAGTIRSTGATRRPGGECDCTSRPGPQIGRFAGVAPGFFPTPLYVPGLDRGCGVGSMNPGVLSEGGCDPGCDLAVIWGRVLITDCHGSFLAGSPRFVSSWSSCIFLGDLDSPAVVGFPVSLVCSVDLRARGSLALTDVHPAPRSQCAGYLSPAVVRELSWWMAGGVDSVSTSRWSGASCRVCPAGAPRQAAPRCCTLESIVGPAFGLARKLPARSAAAVIRRTEAPAEDPRKRVEGRGRPCAR